MDGVEDKEMNINNSNNTIMPSVTADGSGDNGVIRDESMTPDFDAIQRCGGMLGLSGKDKVNVMKRSIKMRKKPTRAGLSLMLVTGTENTTPTPTIDKLDGKIESDITNGLTEQQHVETNTENGHESSNVINPFPVLPDISPKIKDVDDNCSSDVEIDSKEQSDFMNDLQRSLELSKLKTAAKILNKNPEAKPEQHEARLSPSLSRKIDEPKPTSEHAPEINPSPHDVKLPSPHDAKLPSPHDAKLPSPHDVKLPSPHDVKLEPISHPPIVNVSEEKEQTTPSDPIITANTEEPEEMKTDEVKPAVIQSSPALKKKVIDTSEDTEKARPLVKLRKTNNSSIFSADQSNNKSESESTNRSLNNDNDPPPKPLIALKPMKATLPVSALGSVSDELAKPLAQVKLRKSGPRPKSQIVEPTNQNSEPEFIRRAREKRERNSLIIEQSQSQENSQPVNNITENTEPEIQVQLRRSPKKEGSPKPVPARKPSQPMIDEDIQTKIVPDWKKELNSKNTQRVMHRYSSIEESEPLVINKPTEQVEQSELDNGENSPPVWRKELKRMSRGNSRASLQMEVSGEETDDQPEFIKLFKQRQSRLKKFKCSKVESHEISD